MHPYVIEQLTIQHTREMAASVPRGRRSRGLLARTWRGRKAARSSVQRTLDLGWSAVADVSGPAHGDQANRTLDLRAEGTARAWGGEALPRERALNSPGEGLEARTFDN